MANAEFLLADVSNAIDEYFNLMPVAAQACHEGQTAQHITRTEKWTSAEHHYKVYSHGHARTRVTTDLEGAVADAGELGFLDIQVTSSAFRRLDATLNFGIVAQGLTEDPDHAAVDYAKQAVIDINAGIMRKRNELIHAVGGANPYIGTVAAKYNEDGSSYSNSGTDTDAFLTVTDASVDMFQRGQLLDVLDTSSGDAVLAVVTVNDIIRTANWRDLGLGVGIVVTNNTTEGAATSLDTIAATDKLRQHDDGATAGLACSFGNLFPSSYASTLAWFSVADRRTKGYKFLLPNYTDAGSVPLDIETHFGTMADEMASVLGPSRLYRQARGLEMTNAVVVVCPPNLARYAAVQAGNTYKSVVIQAASSLPEAERKSLVAVSGWDGLVIRLPNMPPLVLESERLAPRNTITLFDPSAFTWLRRGDTAKPEWLPGVTGRYWFPVLSSDVRTLKYTATAYAVETLFCETPEAAAYRIKRVTSS